VVKWLLDTNVVSESVQRRPNQAVVDWIAQRPPDQVAISIVTMAELWVGVQASANPERRTELVHWIEQEVENAFADRILPLTISILIEWLQISRRAAVAGRTRAPADLLIAATARAHHLIVVSRNARDFAGTGVLVYDPWNDKSHRMDPA
jgi:predicted nucleic acid-binding protein